MILWEFKDFHPDAELPGCVIPQQQKVHNVLFILAQERECKVSLRRT